MSSETIPITFSLFIKISLFCIVTSSKYSSSNVLNFFKKNFDNFLAEISFAVKNIKESSGPIITVPPAHGDFNKLISGYCYNLDSIKVLSL